MVAELTSGGDPACSDTPSSSVSANLAPLIFDIRETHRKRQDLLRAELRLGNHIEAVYRRFTGLTQLERARLHKKASNGKGLKNDAHQAANAQPDDDSAGVTVATPVPTPLASHGKGQCPHATHDVAALPDDDTANGGDQLTYVTQVEVVLADLATFLVKDAAAAAYCVELASGRDYYANARKPYEKRLERLAMQLPVWPWVAGVRGFGALGLAQIVAECGDLHHYANPAKVWKRMGLAVMPDGQRQRKVADAEQAILHGYSPQRRSLIYVVADSLIKNNREGGFRTYYLAEKERQREKLPDAPQAHIHNRALRHMSKRLLRELWRAWWASDTMSPMHGVPDATPATFLAAD